MKKMIIALAISLFLPSLIYANKDKNTIDWNSKEYQDRQDEYFKAHPYTPDQVTPKLNKPQPDSEFQKMMKEKNRQYLEKQNLLKKPLEKINPENKQESRTIFKQAPKFMLASASTDKISERQEQMKNLIKELKDLTSQPVSEKYYVTYESYEVYNINPDNIDVILNIKIHMNPSYIKNYRRIIKALSYPNHVEGCREATINYRFVNGRLAYDKYYLPYQIGTSNYDASGVITIDGKEVDECRSYRDNLMVVMDYSEFGKGVFNSFKDYLNNKKFDEKKYDMIAERNSKVIPPSGLPLKVKYRLTDSRQINNLSQLIIQLQSCK